MFTWKSVTGVRSLSHGGTLLRRVKDHLTHTYTQQQFILPFVLEKAASIAGVSVPSYPQQDIPNYKWWKKLCAACNSKPTTPLGRQILHSKLIRSLSQLLSIEQIYRLNGSEIQTQNVNHAFFVIGIPRSNAHMAAHVLGCSGLFMCTRQCDTFTPSIMSDLQRQIAFNSQFRYFKNVHPDFISVRRLDAIHIDDDINLQLLTPQSYAWGLLHGLDEYLLQCIEEDQTPVYAQMKKVLQVFKWYERCGNFAFSLTRQINDIDNLTQIAISGMKDYYQSRNFLIYSPLAILSSQVLHDTFANANVIWVHRDISQCLPSLCSSLCIHNALYTGKPPSQSQLGSVGDKVLGIFGSGAENAVDFYSSFPQRRLVHWSNRDVKRSSQRLAVKTLRFYGIDVDRYRRIQMINGATQYISSFRPMHDAKMYYFSLNEGVIGERFRNYIHQFNEFAFQPKQTIKIAPVSDELNIKLKYSSREEIASDTFMTPKPDIIQPVYTDGKVIANETPLSLPKN